MTEAPRGRRIREPVPVYLDEVDRSLLEELAARTVVSALLDDPVYQWRDVPVALVRAAIAGWLERFRDQHFSLTDAVSFELMRQERLGAAFAFDTDFVTAGFELLG